MSPLVFRFIPRWLYSFSPAIDSVTICAQKTENTKWKERRLKRNIKAELVGPNTKRQCISSQAQQDTDLGTKARNEHVSPRTTPRVLYDGHYCSLNKLNCSTAACVISSQTPPTLTVPKDSCWLPCSACKDFWA